MEYLCTEQIFLYQENELKFIVMKQPKNGIFSNTSPFLRLLFAILIIIGSFLIVYLIGLLVALVVFNISMSDITDILSARDQQSLQLLKYFQLILSIGLFLVPPLIFHYLFRTESRNYLKTNIVPSGLSFLIAVFAMLVAVPMINLLAELNSYLDLPQSFEAIETWMKERETEAGDLTQRFLKVNTFSGFLFNLLLIAIIPAIGEELLFRGVIQQIFTEWTKNAHIGVILAAVLFSAFHFQFYGFLPRMLMGIYFGYLVLWSGSIWLAVAAHFINNASAVLLYYFYGEEIVTEEIDTFGTSQESIIFAMISAIFFSALLIALYKHEKRKTESIAG